VERRARANVERIRTVCLKSRSKSGAEPLAKQVFLPHGLTQNAFVYGGEFGLLQLLEMARRGGEEMHRQHNTQFSFWSVKTTGDPSSEGTQHGGLDTVCGSSGLAVPRSQVSLEAGVPLPKGGRAPYSSCAAKQGAKLLLRSLDSFLQSPWVLPGIIDPLQPMDSRAFLCRAFEPALKKAGIIDASCTPCDIRRHPAV
jgi:hypothetical protein